MTVPARLPIKEPHKMPDQPISTLNAYAVARQNGQTVIMSQPIYQMSPEEALQLAAWLVAMNVEHKPAFEDLLERILSI